MENLVMKLMKSRNVWLAVLVLCVFVVGDGIITRAFRQPSRPALLPATFHPPVFAPLSKAGPQWNGHANAVWIHHTWVGDPHSPEEIAAVARKLAAHQIVYVYAHAGPLEANGTIDPTRYQYARRFVTELKKTYPKVQVLAWIGQETVQGRGGVLDMSRVDVRRNIVENVRVFPNQFGFAGVHYDLEPVYGGSIGFYELLVQTRQAIPGKLLSIATSMWVSTSRAPVTITPRQEAAWSSAYFQHLAPVVDQIVVMVYDTSIGTPAVYHRFMAEQTANILASLPTTSVLIGIPSYHDYNEAFDDRIENVDAALSGVVAGLNQVSTYTPDYHFSGVAIYPMWEMTDSDWELFDKQWLGLPPAT